MEISGLFDDASVELPKQFFWGSGANAAKSSSEGEEGETTPNLRERRGSGFAQQGRSGIPKAAPARPERRRSGSARPPMPQRAQAPPSYSRPQKRHSHPLVKPPPTTPLHAPRRPTRRKVNPQRPVFFDPDEARAVAAERVKEKKRAERDKWQSMMDEHEEAHELLLEVLRQTVEGEARWRRHAARFGLNPDKIAEVVAKKAQREAREAAKNIEADNNGTKNATSREAAPTTMPSRRGVEDDDVYTDENDDEEPSSEAPLNTHRSSTPRFSTRSFQRSTNVADRAAAASGLDSAQAAAYRARHWLRVARERAAQFARQQETKAAAAKAASSHKEEKATEDDAYDDAIRRGAAQARAESAQKQGPPPQPPETPPPSSPRKSQPRPETPQARRPETEATPPPHWREYDSSRRPSADYSSFPRRHDSSGQGQGRPDSARRRARPSTAGASARAPKAALDPPKLAKADHYVLLGISRSAAAAEVKKKFFALALKFHPDRNDSPEATEMMSRINEAYSTLSDPHLRKKYDLALPAIPSWQQRYKASGHF